jgi:L-gulono-1,4-lactone dehydrogenase
MNPMQSLSERLKYLAVFHKKWENATRNVKAQPILTFKPANLDDLVEIVKDAEAQKCRVRAFGAGHSFSRVAEPEQYDYFVEMFRLNSCGLYHDFLTEKENETIQKGKRGFVFAEGGLRIKCLNKKLWEMGYALDNMGAFDWQTVSGALSTGTHGTGVNQPAFPDMVKAIVVVGPGGKVMQIEPKDGITNRAKFVAKNPAIELKQDDDLFNTAILSMGAMGLIYKIIFEVNSHYWIKEERKVVEWDTYLKPKLLNGDFQKMAEEEYVLVSFRVNPYLTYDPKKRKVQRLCSLAVQKKVFEKPKRFAGLNAKLKNLGATIIGNLKFFIWLTVRRINRNPEEAPKSIKTAITGTKDKIFVGKSYKALYQTSLGIRRQGISAEFAFPKDYSKLVDIIEQSCAFLDACRKNEKVYQASHIPVRFAPKSRAFLSPCNTGPKMYVDFPTLIKVKSRARFLKMIQEFIVKKLNGLPHWGKMNDVIYHKPDFIGSHYPNVETWKKVRKDFDLNGTFLSDFLINMGLDK